VLDIIYFIIKMEKNRKITLKETERLKKLLLFYLKVIIVTGFYIKNVF